jgi:hypothetical protein
MHTKLYQETFKETEAHGIQYKGANIKWDLAEAWQAVSD